MPLALQAAPRITVAELRNWERAELRNRERDELRNRERAELRNRERDEHASNPTAAPSDRTSRERRSLHALGTLCSLRCDAGARAPDQRNRRVSEVGGAHTCSTAQ